MKIGFSQSVISRSSPILISRSSGPVQSGWRQALRWSIPSGRSRISATRAETLWPRSFPPPPRLAPPPAEHPPPPGLRPLTDDGLDCVRAAQVVGVHPVTGGEQLVDEELRMAALLLS